MVHLIALAVSSALRSGENRSVGSDSKATPSIVGAALAVGIFLFFGWDLAHHHVPYSPQKPSLLTKLGPAWFWLAAFAVRGVGRLRQRRSGSWPSAATTIESGSVDVAGRVYLLKAAYWYSVDSERYGGTYTETFAGSREAEAVLKSLREYPPPARYKPGDPSESAMDPYRDAALAAK